MNVRKNSLMAVVVFLVLSGCGGGGGNNDVPHLTKTKDLFDHFGNGVGVNESGEVVFNENGIPGSASKKFIINSVSANACKGEGTFSPSEFVTSGETEQKVNFSIPFEEFEKCITDKVTFDYDIIIEGAKINYTKSIFNPTYNQDKVFKNAGSDPLYQYQWHLKNTAQLTGVTTPSTAGEDINVESVWAENITGRDVTIAVIDTGVDMFHPDLKDNLLMNLSHNYHTGNLIEDGGINNTTPTRLKVIMDDPNIKGEEKLEGGYSDWKHGTAVAGLIAAKGWNGIGTRGVAPNAKLVSYNALETWQNENDSESRRLYIAGKIPKVFLVSELTHYRLINSLLGHLDKIDIYNNSWGSYDASLDYGFSDVNYENTLEYGVIHGRNGKGAIYVKSAGNGGWSNYEPMQTNGYFIVVSASGPDGKAAPYTTTGPNILINAPGGGSSQSEYVKPVIHKIVTTDMAGDEKGYDTNIQYLSKVQHFNVKGNENYDYTSLMNGTSASAPIVSGVIALMLEANPNLTWRDVRYILAKTAFQNDATDSSWKKNGAGLWYSYIYGFGRVDAKMAVNASKNFKSLGNYFDMKRIKQTANPITKLSNSSNEGIANINENISIEHVAVHLNLDLNTSVEYKNHSSGGKGSTTTQSFLLYPGKNIIKVSSLFDTNNTQTQVKMLEDTLGADEENAIEIATLTNEDPKPVTKVIDISKEGMYKFIVDSNATKWNIDIKTPIPNASPSSLNIVLTSPSNTTTILSRAPNILDNNQTFINAKLSSVEFLDEKSKGKWKLEVKDIYGSSFKIYNWDIEITGH